MIAQEVLQLQEDLIGQFYSDDWDECDREVWSNVTLIVARALLGDVNAQRKVRKLVAWIESDRGDDAV